MRLPDATGNVASQPLKPWPLSVIEHSHSLESGNATRSSGVSGVGSFSEWLQWSLRRCVLPVQRAVRDRFHQQRTDCCQRLPLCSRVDIAEIRVAQTRRWSPASPTRARARFVTATGTDSASWIVDAPHNRFPRRFFYRSSTSTVGPARCTLPLTPRVYSAQVLCRGRSCVSLAWAYPACPLRCRLSSSSFARHCVRSAQRDSYAPLIVYWRRNRTVVPEQPIGSPRVYLSVSFVGCRWAGLILVDHGSGSVCALALHARYGHKPHASSPYCTRIFSPVKHRI